MWGEEVDFSKIHVLILEGYARQALPFIKEFKNLGCTVSVLCNSKLDVAYASRYPDFKILGVCDPDRYDESESYIRELIKTGTYDIVVPLVDFSAKILSRNKEEFCNYSIIASNDKEVFEKSQDKLSVMIECAKNDIPCPKTKIDATNLRDIEESDLKFPIIIKPRRGCGASGFIHIENKVELQKNIASLDISLKEYVVQELIPQEDVNLSCNLFIDNDGEVKSCFVYASHRWFPLKGGTGTFNTTVYRKDVINTCVKLAKLMNLRGAVGIDLIHDPRDNIAKVLEINPRIMACAQIGFDAGVNLAQQILEKELGFKVTSMMDYKDNISIRITQSDILWFLKSKNRFTVKPSWFKLKNVKDQIFDIRDPLPWFAFSLQSLQKYYDRRKGF